MRLLAAMEEMTDSMSAVNASRRQIRGITGWRDLVAAAVDAGRLVTGPIAAAGNVAVPGSRTHRRWLATAQAIVTSLDGHARQAEFLAARARDRASRARAAAEDARISERLARYRAATCEDHTQAAIFEAQAAAAAELAEEAEKRARQYDLVAGLCDQWQMAADDAAVYGRRLAGREDMVHRPVGEAIAGAGGRPWIATDKNFLAGDE